MSTKRGRGAKVLKAQQEKNKRDLSAESEDRSNISAIDKASFLEGLQQNYGNPLHSTAIEEDLNVQAEGQEKKGNAGRKDAPEAVKTAAKKPGYTVKETDKENEQKEEKTKRNGKSTGGKSKARPEKGGETYIKDGAPQVQRAEVDAGREEPDSGAIAQKVSEQAGKGLTRLVGKKPAERKSAGQTSAARPVKNEQKKSAKKRAAEPGSGNSSMDFQSEEESDSGVTKRRYRRVISSDDDDLDTSWKPSPNKAKMHSLVRSKTTPSDTRKSRKSSSGSTSAGAKKAGADQLKKKRGGRSGRTDLEVALDAFLDFCEQYSESVESKAVKQSIECFSSDVKQQLLEKISSNKDFKQLKRENAKVGSMIRTKTQRLLDAKYELMRAERQVFLLEKEKAELKLRLADLRQGQAFLHDVRELNKQYRDYRRKHPTEKETYGASSLPALLLETKYVQSAKDQLNGADKQPEKRQKTNGK